MNCNEAAEFVSALCDGETIPRTAATHIGSCEACQAALNEYIGMGAELRRMASLELVEETKPLAWAEKQQAKQTLWQKGWEMMRIPKFAFVLLVAGIVALASSLAMVKVHAHSQGNAVMLRVGLGSGEPYPCPISTVDPKQAQCVSWGPMNNQMVGYHINLLGCKGDRIELGVRIKVYPSPKLAGSGSYFLTDFDTEPQKQYWFEPGETLKVDVAGLGALSITGDWTDHVPVLFEKSEHSDIDPGPDKLRIESPLLLRGKEVVGEIEGSGGETTGEIGIYLPHQGLYEISLSPQEGAVEGRVKGNRIDFTMDGQPYAFITGTPITRSDKIWILHTANYKPKVGDSNGSTFFMSTKLNHPLVNANPDK